MSDITPPDRLEQTLDAGTGGTTALELLSAVCPLSKGRLKDAMTKGAVELERRGKRRKLRRARYRLQPGDRLHLAYDANLLSRRPPRPERLLAETSFSIWHKPAGLLSQGNRWGDHCSLLRMAEKITGREVWLIHRLDREAMGLIVVAHDERAAASLSRQFAERSVDKGYRVVVLGDPGSTTIDYPLDGKPASTRVEVLDRRGDHSLLEVTIETGRRHQIRRHLDAVACPVLGDPAYGRGNQDNDGLHLCAWRLGLRNPADESPVRVELPRPMRPTWFDRLETQ